MLTLTLWRTGTCVAMGDGVVVQKAFTSSREQLLQLQGKWETGRQERGAAQQRVGRTGAAGPTLLGCGLHG